MQIPACRLRPYPGDVLRRVLLHLAGLLLVAALGVGGGMWFLWRSTLAARTAPPGPGETLSGQVMNVARDGRLELLQWNGRRCRVRVRGVELLGQDGLRYLIDRASSQNVDVRVAAVDAGGEVCGDVGFLGLDLALDLLRKGAAREDLSGRDPVPDNPQARALAEQQGRGAPPARGRIRLPGTIPPPPPPPFLQRLDPSPAAPVRRGIM